ncbi:hypothetical protein chiPu_0016805 [Chiloscyllium punctatum]|uniref:Uncharacterized protein n=1 Tax=Chiloscyllium punctatum TaxID=137246 RepID=A0A401T6J9_CHIPU|nr:hypothetical protein [Chiloscyllium punctatum]
MSVNTSPQVSWLLSTAVVYSEGSSAQSRPGGNFGQIVNLRETEGFEEETSVNVVNEIVTLGQNMGLEVDEDDVTELVEDHRQELSTEDLVEL